MSPRGHTQSKIYKVTQSEMFEKLLEILSALKMKVVERDNNTGTIVAATGLSLLSTGTLLRIDVQSTENQGETLVSIEARPKLKTVLIDYGQSARDMAKIFANLDQFFTASEETVEKTPEETPKQKSESQNLKCPHCGSPVREGDVFCQNCGKKIR